MRARSRRGSWFAIASLLALAAVAGGCQSLDLDRSALQGQINGPLVAPGTAAQAAGAAAEGHAGSGQDLAPASDQSGDLSAPAAARLGPARQLVYTARFEVATSNVDEALGRFTRAAQSAGGYLESREDSHVVCRIPADRFEAFVATIPSLGSVVRQTIRNDDVTRKYHDLKLHIETAECSRRRVLGLLERAEKIEDIIKLEEELQRLTATIEGLQGVLRDLSEQIAYSRVEVFFSPRTPESRLGRPAAQCPFAWINQVGAEQVTAGFGPVEMSDNASPSLASALLPGGLSVGPLEGFLVVKRDRAELKAITPEASKLWVREFAVPRRAKLEFWSHALRNDLVEHRGYSLAGENRVWDLKGNEGVELVCDVAVEGQPHRYLVAVYALDGGFLRPGNIVRTVEFTAPVATFEKYAAVVRASCGGNRF